MIGRLGVIGGGGGAAFTASFSGENIVWTGATGSGVTITLPDGSTLTQTGASGSYTPESSGNFRIRLIGDETTLSVLLIPASEDFVWSDNFFTDDHVDTNNGHSNIRSSWSTFFDPHLEQSETSIVGSHGGHYRKTDNSVEGVCLDYSLNGLYWFNGSHVVARDTYASRATHFSVVFLRGGEEVHRTPNGSDEHVFEPVQADQVRLVLIADQEQDHNQFNYLALRWAAS